MATQMQNLNTNTKVQHKCYMVTQKNHGTQIMAHGHTNTAVAGGIRQAGRWTNCLGAYGPNTNIVTEKDLSI